jgi:hypothetical protein
METPVLYFYSPSPVDAHVRVAFPKGLLTEWYPQAEYHVDQQSGTNGAMRRLEANLNGLDTSLTSMIGSLEWNHIRIEPNTAPVLPMEDRPNRYYAARATDAAPIAAGDQHEKFLFYRGVGRIVCPISAGISPDGGVTVADLGLDSIPTVILFENRGGRMGYRNAGAVSGSITLNRPSLDSSFLQLQHDLEDALTEQGLFRKEAQAMVATWQDSWFEEGSRVIYLVPRRAVDSILPLQVDPSPSHTARVFVGRMELITSETKHAVEAAIAKNDGSVIDLYGRFLDPILDRISVENPTNARQIEQFRAGLSRNRAKRAPRAAWIHSVLPLNGGAGNAPFALRGAQAATACRSKT